MPVLPKALRHWLETDIDLWRKSEAREHLRNPVFVGKQADWLDTIGRERLAQFATEYGIIRPARLRNPFITLTRSYRSASAQDAGYNGGTAYREVQRPNELPWVDHPEMWKAADGEIVFTSFPYDVDEDECRLVAKSNDLRIEIRPDLNFYTEGAHCVIWRAGEVS